MGKALLRGIVKVFDISGANSSNNLTMIYKKNIKNSYITDYNNLKSDFIISGKKYDVKSN